MNYFSQYSDNETMIAPAKYSLRYKLLSLLILIPLVSLSVFVISGSRYFSKEKNSVMYDSAFRKATVLASEYSLSVQSFKRELDSILFVSNLKKNSFSAESLKRFKEHKNIEYIFLVQFSPKGLRVKDKMINFPRELKKLEFQSLQIEQEKEWLISKNFSESISDFPVRSRFFKFIKKVSDEKQTFLVALVKLPELFESFAENGLFTSYIVDSKGQISIQPKFLRVSQKAQVITDPKLFYPAFVAKTPQGVYEEKNGHEKNILIAYSQTKIPGTYVFSTVDRSVVDRSVWRYVAKSALILLMVLSLVILIGFFASFKLTTSLRQLMEMMKQIASGDFKVRSTIKSNDEIQVLGKNIEWMSTEVRGLLESQVEQTRMEAELGMVQLVQKNLFPPLSHRVGDFEIECRYGSASEAGGDWFHYSVIGKHLILWIGDATGHGASAAMITSAAKSASAVIEMHAKDKLPDPGRILEILNHAVNDTAKKSVMMTFFLATINIETGKMVYANASHEFPLIIPDKEKLNKKDLHFLCDVTGKRLGDQFDATYKTSHYDMKRGETLFLFTDGITDLENEQGMAFGEGRLMRAMMKISPQAHCAGDLADALDRQILDYRGNTPLVDDLMYMVCRYNPVKQSFDEEAS